jgi:hypothetical protein
VLIVPTCRSRTCERGLSTLPTATYSTIWERSGRAEPLYYPPVDHGNRAPVSQAY